MRRAVDRDGGLLGRFEQGRLGPRVGAVELVEHDHVGEHRAGPEPEPERLVVGHHRAGHVARQEIGCALDPVERAADGGRDDLRQQGLADTRDVLDQQVAARQQAGGRHLGHLALAGNDTIDGIDDVAPEAARASELCLVETSRITGGRAVAATLTVSRLGRSSSAHRHPRPPRRQESARGARRQLFQIIGKFGARLQSETKDS